jgi:hypothetical protein
VRLGQRPPLASLESWKLASTLNFFLDTQFTPVVVDSKLLQVDHLSEATVEFWKLAVL